MDKFYLNGNLKAKFIKYLKDGECPCKWEEKPNYFTEGNKVYKKIIY